MKKKLLKPPKNKEIIIVPPYQKTKLICAKLKNILTAHQPGFFNSGVALKFLILKKLSLDKRIIFVDTDRIDLSINLKTETDNLAVFFKKNYTLFDYPNPSKKEWIIFFRQLKFELKKRKISEKIIKNIDSFKKIIVTNNKKKLKEVLAESFLKFYGLDFNYSYLSEEFNSQDYKDFFSNIYKNCGHFQKVFNKALDNYKQKFKFRFKNFPFPKLKEGELPFWIIKDNKRFKLFKNDLYLKDFDRELISPRASALTIFLRFYRSDCFIHGVGGKNYEWVNDRIIEDFFKQKAPFYLTISGTFLPEGITTRNIPFFFSSPNYLKNQLDLFLSREDETKQNKS
ncbi:MAG: hypothetical protein K9L95_01615 [Candidatus Omnitrophica bacterium]|nr:hypothetical protein [Candidatus Omnitrophota bacterium]MCF7878153.1 hypothetical protein [Candidatus Omnitrophota bacterium]